RSWGRRRVMPLSSRCLASCRPSLCGIETINGCDIALLGVTPRFRRDCSQKPVALPEWANCDEAYYLTPATATHIQLRSSAINKMYRTRVPATPDAGQNGNAFQSLLLSTNSH